MRVVRSQINTGTEFAYVFAYPFAYVLAYLFAYLFAHSFAYLSPRLLNFNISIFPMELFK